MTWFDEIHGVDTMPQSSTAPLAFGHVCDKHLARLAVLTHENHPAHELRVVQLGNGALCFILSSILNDTAALGASIGAWCTHKVRQLPCHDVEFPATTNPRNNKSWMFAEYQSRKRQACAL